MYACGKIQSCNHIKNHAHTMSNTVYSLRTEGPGYEATEFSELNYEGMTLQLAK